MEVFDHLVDEEVNFNLSISYLKRKGCPGCFAPAQSASLEVCSVPAAEELPLDQHGKFLSGYTNKRVFFSYHRCSVCELLYCPTYFTQEQLDGLYKDQSENMAEVPLAARARTQKAYYDLLKKHHLPKGDYLEIGADIGLFAQFFAHNPQVNRMFLYEPNVQAHEALKKNVGNIDYKIITKNYVARDIAPNSLMTAAIIHTLDHVLAPRQLMRDIYQNLKPGGIAFIVTHDESSLLARILKKKWPPFTLQHPHLFKPATIKALLRAEGFDVLACKKTANYFPLTHFINGGLVALGLEKWSLPDFPHWIVPIKLGNIATLAQKPLGMHYD